MKKLLSLLLVCSSSFLYAQVGAGIQVVSNAANTSIQLGSSTGTPPLSTSVIASTTTPVTTAQWHFAGQTPLLDNMSNIASEWLYGILSTDKKEYVGCGYSLGQAGGTRDGAIIKLDHIGNLAWARSIGNVTALDFSTWTAATASTFTLYTYTSGIGGLGGTSSLWKVAKASDGYVAVGSNSDGFFGSGILIVEFDDDGNFLNGTPIAVVAPANPGGAYLSAASSNAAGLSFDIPNSRGYSVAIDPNTNSIKNIVVGGTIAEKNGSNPMNNRAFILTLNYNGSTASPGAPALWAMGNTCYGGNNYSNDGGAYGGNVFTKILTKSTGGSSYKIYACGSVSSSDDNQTYSQDPYGNSLTGITTVHDFDKDMWVVSMDYDNSAPAFSSLAQVSYNKNNIAAGGTYISDPTFTYTYNEVGPMTARNYAIDPVTGNITGINTVLPSATMPSYTWQGITPAGGIWLSAPYNKVEQATDMIFAADGYISLIGLVNVVGDLSNNLSHNGTDNLLNGFWNPPFEYIDGDAFLLKLDPATLSLTGYSAKNVGHFSGGNFTMNLKQDKYGQFIIAGSTADMYGSTASMYTLYAPSPDINLQDPKFITRATSGDDGTGWNAFVVGTNDDANPDVWRRSFRAEDARAGTPATGGNSESTFCMFTMDTTADGGYILGGNNNNHGDDWTITKFAPLYQELMIQGIGDNYTTFGGTDIPAEHDITGSETWNSSLLNIASKVVVQNGGILTIESSIFSFAASDQLWDYSMAADAGTASVIGCGIIVEPGGKLVISNSILQGISITGQHNMWDGIVVHGDPGAAGPQGEVQISNSVVQDARYGMYVSDNYRTYLKTSVTAGNLQGSNYSSRYNGYATYGGGKVTADNVEFLNCRFGVNFQNSPMFLNHSVFRSCSFNSDATGLGDICFYTDANGGLLPANTHFSAWNMKEISLFGNTFTCDPSFVTTVRPVGVIASATKMNISDYCTAVTYGGSCASSVAGYISGNAFTNLNYGIICGNPPGVSPMVRINANAFDNNGNCVSASGMANALIVTGNAFAIPGNYLFTPTSYNYPHPTGVTLAGCHGYDVSLNAFGQCNTCGSALSVLGSKGIVVNDGGSDNEVVKLNNFGQVEYASVASQTNGDDATNTGLQFHCNNYSNSYVDITRSSYLLGDGTSVPGTLRPHQGECGISSASPAGNQFNPICNTTGGKLHVEDADVVQVVTYNNNASGSTFDPGACIDGSLYINNSCPSFGSPTIGDACPSRGDYISPAGLVQGLTDLAELDIAIHNNEDDDLAPALQSRHDEIVGYVVRYNSLHHEYLAAAALLEYYHKYRDALPFYLMAGLPLMAELMHSKLPMVTADDIMYAAGTQIAIGLYSRGKSWMSIDSTLRDTISHIVQYNSPTGYMAGSINMLLGTGTVTWPIPVMDTTIVIDTSEYRITRGVHNNNVIQAINNASGAGKNGFPVFSLYPNPTFGNFIIQASGGGKFTLYTLVGQEVQEYKVAAGQTEMRLPANLAAGMYMGRFRPDDGGTAKEVRLVYQP